MIAAWNRFWFEKCSAASLGVFRICFAFILIVNGLALFPDLGTWFGSQAVAGFNLRSGVFGIRTFNAIAWFPNEDLGVKVVFGAYMLASIFLFIGLYARASALVLYLTLLSLHSSNPMIINSGDLLMRLISFFLIFVDSGAAFSLRNPNPLKSPVSIRPLGWRLIQIQTSVVYVATWIQKMNGDDWPGGLATYYSSRLEPYWKYRMPYVFEHLWTIRASTWGTLAVELALGTLIWVKELRIWVILAGIAFHLGIELTMHIHLFEWMMVVLLISFFKSEDLTLISDFESPAKLSYDPKS